MPVQSTFFYLSALKVKPPPVSSSPSLCFLNYEPGLREISKGYRWSHVVIIKCAEQFGKSVNLFVTALKFI